MEKISLLVFSIENHKEVMQLVDDLYETVDDIVIVDGSSRANHKKLLGIKKNRRLDKIRIFQTVALGYAEPFRNYGMDKCRGDWILLLDVDERLSDDLKGDLRGIVKKTGYDVLKIRRYENYFNDKRTNNFYTRQIRLFRKRSLDYLGLTHEHPKIRGRLGKLEGSANYIKHINDLKHERYYNKMDLFSDTHIMILLLRDIFIGINTREVGSTSDIRRIYDSHARLKRMQTDEIIRIGRIIREKGITKYLGLDNDRTVEKLNRKYGKGKQGIDLLIKLLIKRYKNEYP
jgi:glycosyltransferase involved in cell wall biosynthesis